ncbi:MAG: conjugative transposon protein TraN [Amoebophilaceae bacterium]|nr:conjugative transposon protein TraN [Amoebophilaceae bacterium]
MMVKVVSRLAFLFLFGFKTSVVSNDLLMPASLKEVKVAHQYISTLLFDEEVKEVLLASKEYVANVHKNIILLRAIKFNTAPTSIVVLFKSGKQIFNGLLSTTQEPQEVYDYRTGQAVGEEAPQQDPSLAKKIHYLKKLPQAYCCKGIHTKYYSIALTNVFHDERYTYLKVHIENKTALKFDLFEASFQHINNKKSRILVDPVYQLADCSVPAYGAKTLVYVLPRYTTHKSGRLLVSFAEQSGARVFNLSIPGRIILKARYYANQ